jgi:hypothetical protein
MRRSTGPPRRQSGTVGAPPDQAGEPIRDLYDVSDIRFVMRELGVLSTKVDRLIDDVGKQGEKIDTVRNQISFVRGAVWVIGGLLALVMVGVAIYVRLQSH